MSILFRADIVAAAAAAAVDSVHDKIDVHTIDDGRLSRAPQQICQYCAVVPMRFDSRCIAACLSSLLIEFGAGVSRIITAAVPCSIYPHTAPHTTRAKRGRDHRLIIFIRSF